MGGMLSQPVTNKRSNQGDGLGLSYGLSSMQGWRSEMEDAHDVQIGLKYGLDDWSYFAVFDGHAGKRAAAFAAWNLLEFILRDEQFKLDTDNLPEHVYIEPPELEKLHEMIRVENSSNSSSSSSSSSQLIAEEKQSNGDEKTKSSDENNQDCAKTDEKSSTDEVSPLSSTTQQNTSSTTTNTTTTTPTTTTTTTTSTTSTTENSNTPTTSNEAPQIKQASATVQGGGQIVSKFCTLSTKEQSEIVKKAIRSGFLRIDQSLRDSAQDMSGSTAICSLISPTRLFIANCGDSRAILCGKKSLVNRFAPLYKKAEVLFATEDHKPYNPKERARIIAAGGCATQRINGTLAVSRALGDFEFKKVMQFGPCDQMVSPEPEVTVIERNSEDSFLVLACDGIWDVMENWELCQFIDYKLKLEPKLEDVCSSVLDVCLHKGSRDNMSIIIVVFENGPKFSEEELEKDRRNDELLKVLIRKFNNGEKHDNFNEFMYCMKQRFTQMEADWKSDAYLPPGAGLIAKHEMIREMFEKEFEEKSDPKTDDE